MDRKRLGRGLDALIPQSDALTATLPPAAVPVAGVHPEVDLGTPRNLPVDSIIPNPYQPRSDFSDEELAELASSIRSAGVIQPLLVRRKDGQFELIAGERRLRAARLAGLAEVPVVIREASEEQMLELALIENIQREDLNPVDRARAYERYCREFALKPEEVGRRVGEDRSTVTNYLRMLDLPQPILDRIRSRELGYGHARALVSVTDAELRARAAKVAVDKQFSVREVEEFIRAEKRRQAGPQVSAKMHPLARQIRDLERQLESAIGTRVAIKPGRGKHRGRIVIDYYSLDDFDRITGRLGLKRRE